MSSEPPLPHRFSDFFSDDEADLLEVREVIEEDGSVKTFYTWTTGPRTPRYAFEHDSQERLFHLTTNEPMGKYSEVMMEHVMSPRNGGVMENPTLTGHAGTPGRGAFMVLYLDVDRDRIRAAKYHTVGCGPTIACGSMLSELVVGRSIEDCRELTADDLIEALDGVPPDKLHCPALAIAALRDALSHWEPRKDY